MGEAALQLGFEPAEAAGILGLSERRIRQMAAGGELMAVAGSDYLLIDPNSSPALRIAAGSDAGPGVGPGLANLSEAKRQTLYARYQCISQCRQQYESIDEGARPKWRPWLEAWAASWSARHGHKVSRPTLERWLSSFRREGIAGLMDGRKYSGPASMSPEAWEVFVGMYCTQSAPKIPRLYQHVSALAQSYNWQWPSLRTVQQHVAGRLDPKLLAAGQAPKRFRDRCVPHVERNWLAVPAMACWVADHRQLDLFWPHFVRNATTGQHEWVWHRPWLTKFLDGRTWYVPCHTLAFDSPNGNRVMATFGRGVIEHGKPETLYLDNGKDFRMVRFSGGRKRPVNPNERIVDEGSVKPLLETLGIACTFALPFNAKAKIIEPSFKLEAEWFDRTWPTYCGRSPEHRPEQLKGLKGQAEAFAAARIPTEDFQRIMFDRDLSHERIDAMCLAPLAAAYANYLAADYHLRQSPSRWCGELSSQRAFVELRRPDFQPQRPAEQDLALLMLPSVPVIVGKNGIYVRPLGMTYWSPSLEDRRCCSGRDARRKIVYRYDPDDRSKIWVFDQGGKFLAVALPYHGVDIHPLATGEADRERLSEAIGLQRRTAKEIMGTLKTAQAFAGNVLLAGRQQAADALGRLDIPSLELNPPSPVIAFQGQTSIAAEAGRQAAAKQAATRRTRARDFYAQTGTDNVPTAGARGAATRSALDYLPDGPAATGMDAPERDNHAADGD